VGEDTDGTRAPVPPSAAPDLVLVADRDRVAPALADLSGTVVGVDVERADADNYHRHAALVQVGVVGTCVLIDGLALDELPELDAFLGDRLPVLHAAVNDVAPLASRGVAPARLADTAVAAALLGRPTGLDALLGEVLEVRLTAEKERFQRADWAQRPLPDDMLAYAAGDVVHLPALWSALEGELATAGRTTWYVQELAAALAAAATDTRDWRRVRGVGRLAPRAQEVARALWEAREQLARDRDVAPNLLLHEQSILALATEPPTTAKQLARRGRRRRPIAEDEAEALMDAVTRGLEAEPPPRDPDRRRWTDQDDRAFDRLRTARADVAADLGLDPGVLCPSKVLKEAVRLDPQDEAALCDAAGLRPWQRELLGDVLWTAYRDA
jgi:ribonuclease D